MLHEIRLDPGVELEVPINIDIETPGIHELAVVVFADPYDSSLDPRYRESSVAIKTGGRRAIVIVEDETNGIARQLPEIIQGTSIPKDVTIGFRAVLVTPPDKTTTHPSKRPLYTVTQGKPGEMFPYQLWASNFDGEQGADYALVVFQDYHQVPVAGKEVIIASLNPDEEIILDATAELPPTPGVSQMQVISIYDPYRSILHGEVRVPFVFSSFRIAIHIEE